MSQENATSGQAADDKAALPPSNLPEELLPVYDWYRTQGRQLVGGVIVEHAAAHPPTAQQDSSCQPRQQGEGHPANAAQCRAHHPVQIITASHETHGPTVIIPQVEDLCRFLMIPLPCAHHQDAWQPGQ